MSKENVNGDTPLHVAAKAGHVPVCKVLIDCGADVLARNQKNRTPRSQIKVNRKTSTILHASIPKCRFQFPLRWASSFGCWTNSLYSF